MKKIDCARFRKGLAEVIDNVFHHDERYAIYKSGKKRAVLLSAEDYDAIEEYIREADERREVK